MLFIILFYAYLCKKDKLKKREREKNLSKLSVLYSRQFCQVGHS